MPDLTVWPTDGADGSVSSELRWRKMARQFAPSGVVSLMGVALVAGPAITVQAGSAWLDGHYAELASVQTVPVTANGILVLRFTPADNHCELLYRDGSGLQPTRTDPTWELVLARMVAGVMTSEVQPAGSGNGFGVPVVGRIPDYPYEGQQVILYAGYHAQAFHLLYTASAPAPYQWVVIGGAPYSANVNTSETAALSAGYGDLPTAGPDLILTMPGIYRVRLGFTGSVAAVAGQAAMACNLLPTAGASGFGAVHNIAANTTITATTEQDYTIPLSAMAYGSGNYAQLRARYYTPLGTPAISIRWLTAMPLRVSALA